MAKPRPGKYDSILPGLPGLPSADQKWQDKIDRVKAEVLSGLSSDRDTFRLQHEALTDRFEFFPVADIGPVGWANRYASLRQTKDQIEELLSLVNLHIEAYTQLLIGSQEDGGEGWGRYGASEKMLRMASGHNVRVHHEPHAVVKDKDANRLWAVKQGLERLLSLPWATVNLMSKELLLKGQEPPDGVEVFGKKTIVFTEMKTATEPRSQPIKMPFSLDEDPIL